MSILNSPITWEILEFDFAKSFNQTAKTGPHRGFKAIGDGQGFLSNLALVEFDWIEDHNGILPKRAVVKICTTEKSGSTESECLIAELNDNELEIYSVTGDEALLFQGIQRPKFFCGRKYSTGTGYLAVEFIDDSITRLPWQGLPDQIILQGLRIIASLTIKSIKHPELLKKWECRAYYTMMKDLTVVETMDRRLRIFAEIYPTQKENIKFMLTKLTDLFGDFDEFERVSKSTSKVMVFCHGDMWAPNLLFRSENGNDDLIAVIDWQLSHIGTPTEDLIYLLFSGISPNEYPQKYKTYLKHFFDLLSAELKDEEMPWASSDELQKQYERSFSLFVMMLISWMADMKSDLLKAYKDSPEQTDLFNQKAIFLCEEVARCVRKWF